MGIGWVPPGLLGAEKAPPGNDWPVFCWLIPNVWNPCSGLGAADALGNARARGGGGGWMGAGGGASMLLTGELERDSEGESELPVLFDSSRGE